MCDKDGGAAFPWNGQHVWKPEKGMSLRDWYAGMALRAQVSTFSIHCDEKETWSEKLAKSCYEIADAMIKERSK